MANEIKDEFNAIDSMLAWGSIIALACILGAVFIGPVIVSSSTDFSHCVGGQLGGAADSRPSFPKVQ